MYAHDTPHYNSILYRFLHATVCYIRLYKMRYFKVEAVKLVCSAEYFLYTYIFTWHIPIHFPQQSV